jgi:hypothetical protein
MNVPPPPAIAIAPEGQKVLDKAALIVANSYSKLSSSLVKRTHTLNLYTDAYNKHSLPQNMAMILEPHIWPATIPVHLTEALNSKEQTTFASALRVILEGRLAFLQADVTSLQTQLATFLSDEDVTNKFLTLIPTLASQPTYIPLLVWSFRLVQTRQDLASNRALKKHLQIRFEAPPPLDSMAMEEEPFVDMTNEDLPDPIPYNANSSTQSSTCTTSASSSSSSSTATSSSAPRKKKSPTAPPESELSQLIQQVATLTKTVATLQTKFTGSPQRGGREPSPSRLSQPTGSATSQRHKKKNSPTVPQLTEIQTPTTAPRLPSSHRPFPPNSYGQYPASLAIPQQQFHPQYHPAYNAMPTQYHQAPYLNGAYSHSLVHIPPPPYTQPGKDCHGFAKNATSYIPGYTGHGT